MEFNKKTLITCKFNIAGDDLAKGKAKKLSELFSSLKYGENGITNYDELDDESIEGKVIFYFINLIERETRTDSEKLKESAMETRTVIVNRDTNSGEMVVGDDEIDEGRGGAR